MQPSDDALLAAMRNPRRARLSHWELALHEHRGHRSFRTQDWAFSREYGFSCDCCGEEAEWRIDVGTLRMMLPHARDAFLRLRRHHSNSGSKAAKRLAYKANIKAKALLHFHLTKEQRWDLRATKSFAITGQDGRPYRITEGTSSNVMLLDRTGKESHRLCVVAKGPSLPVYDLMLAQKLMLESDSEAFWKIAVVHDLRTNETRHPGRQHRRGTAWDLPDEVVDEPVRWVEEQLRQTG